MSTPRATESLSEEVVISETQAHDDEFSKHADTRGNESKRDFTEMSSSDPELEQLQKEMDLEPTRIILAKVKGYRAWPAMVLDESRLPENIRALKPKSTKLSKKQKKPVIVIPVRFFSDDTYIWMKSSDVSPLNGEAIEKYLAKKANSKKDALTDAYLLAQSPPDMVNFIAWGSKGEPPSPVHTQEPDSEGPTKKLKLSLKQKKPAKNHRSHTPVLIESPHYSEEEIEGECDVEGFDSDWGLEEAGVDVQNGDYIFEDEAEQRQFFENFPTSTELADHLSEYQEQFAGLHHSVSPQLMQEGGDEKKVMTELRKVEKLVASADTPLIAFRKSPLYRVLLLTVHKPAEVSKSESVRTFIGKIFGNISLKPCEITEEDLREPEPEPAQEVEGESNDNGELADQDKEVKKEMWDSETEACKRPEVEVSTETLVESDSGEKPW